MLARPALFALALAVFARAGSPRFAPAPQSEAEKRFSARSEYVLERLEQERGGERIELPAPAMEGSRSWRLAVTDRYIESRDGLPLRLERTIEEIGADNGFGLEVLGEVGEYGARMTSDLEGAELVARYDADLEKVVLEPAEDTELEAGLLEGLREDLDLRALLPPEEVALGDRWQVPADRLLDVLLPGGDLVLRPEEITCTNRSLMEPIDVLLVALTGSAAGLEEAGGDVTLTWRETRGGEAHISVEIDISCEADISEAVLALAERGGIEVGREDYHASLARELTGEGSLVWSLEEGHFRSLEIEIEEEDVVTLGYSIGAEPIEFHAELSVTSTVEHSAGTP